jgi:hypothetical protein
MPLTWLPSVKPELRGSSAGDSGGPAFIFVRGEPFLFGVDSNGAAYWGDEISSFENVTRHLIWIKSIAAKLGSKFSVRSSEP